MRLVHAADLHLGLSRYIDRLPDMTASLDRLAADTREADVLLIAGDTFDSRRPGPDALRAFAEFIGQVQCPVVIIPGNHDGMTTIGDASTHALLWLKALDLPNVYVLLDPGWHQVNTPNGPLAVFALPYPHKRGLDAVLADVPVDERATAVGRKVEEVIRTLGEQGSLRPGYTVFLGHVSTIHARLGSERLMKMGWDAAIDVNVLEPFDYAALGHIHRQQQVGPNAWYAGSPEYLDFGDESGDKGWLLVDVERGVKPVVTRRSSNARPLATAIVRGTDTEGDYTLPSIDWAAGPIIRLLVTTTKRPSPARLAEWVQLLRSAGAVYVKTEVRLERPAPIATPQEVNAESDTLTLLHEWLVEKGQPDEPTMALGRALLASLDAA